MSDTLPHFTLLWSNWLNNKHNSNSCVLFLLCKEKYVGDGRRSQFLAVFLAFVFLAKSIILAEIEEVEVRYLFVCKSFKARQDLTGEQILWIIWESVNFLGCYVTVISTWHYLHPWRFNVIVFFLSFYESLFIFMCCQDYLRISCFWQLDSVSENYQRDRASNLVTVFPILLGIQRSKDNTIAHKEGLLHEHTCKQRWRRKTAWFPWAQCGLGCLYQFIPPEYRSPHLYYLTPPVRCCLSSVAGRHINGRPCSWASLQTSPTSHMEQG